MPAVEATGLEVTLKPPARKVTPRCVHVELKASGLWVVRLDRSEMRSNQGARILMWMDSHVGSGRDGGVR